MREIWGQCGLASPGGVTYNTLTALKRLALPAELLQARPKRLRFLFFNKAGRFVQHARKTILRLSMSATRLAELLSALTLLPAWV